MCGTTFAQTESSIGAGHALRQFTGITKLEPSKACAHRDRYRENDQKGCVAESHLRDLMVATLNGQASPCASGGALDRPRGVEGEKSSRIKN
jgi:hypothetical protein